MDSILTSVKKYLGISEEITDFDIDIITHINTAFMVLRQIGIGPEGGFFIADEKAVWGDYIPDMSKIQGVKTYVFAKVKMIFDPPMSSAVAEAMNQTIKELEVRLNLEAEKGEE